MKEHLRTAIWRDIIISLRKRRFNSADGDKEEKNMTVKELIKELETCKPDAVVSIVINEINLEVTELITPAPEIVELS